MLLLNVQLKINPANDSGFGVDFFEKYMCVCV